MKKGFVIGFLFYFVISVIIESIFPNFNRGVVLIIAIIVSLIVKDFLIVIFPKQYKKNKQQLDQEKDERHIYIKTKSAWITLKILIYSLAVSAITCSILGNQELQFILSSILVILLLLYMIVYLWTEKTS